ncbi:ATP-binding protein [Actinomadura sp. HBU206391]|uniref:sensor histidine kinase n=1 Tax=Actinomadura sp. HBU206391 TaxID=2731692 RepID=UPI00165069C1|nr:ATP-binding protein [Actinomadura sp. HBU206391]MBC6461709.1 HAMP domain-containing protein [Actinomadura sp. HBU206391]
MRVRGRVLRARLMRRPGLRARMAVSYMLVTAAAVVVVEVILLGVLLPQMLTGSGAIDRARSQADRDAKALSLTASQLSETGVSGDVKGSAPLDLLTLTAKYGAQQTALGGASGGDQGLSIPVNGDPDAVGFEALVTPDGAVVRSTAKNVPGDGTRLAIELPRSLSGGAIATIDGRRVVWAVSPVLTVGSEERIRKLKAAADHVRINELKAAGQTMPSEQPFLLGAVYVQVPVAVASPVSGEILSPFLIAGGVVLLLVVPVGMVFGLLSTGRLIRRVSRLADVTAAVADGDFKTRVDASGDDEVGRLESSVNRMTEQLDAALATERRLAGAGARRSERARIARELHDSISQDLFSLRMLASGMCGTEDSALRAQAEKMERTVGRTMREMQALLLELRPVALEDLGLVPALEELCRAYEIRLGIRVVASLADVRLDPAAEHAVLRVVQESLGNAVKHARPQTIQVRLAEADGRLSVEVRDDGRGFEVDEAGERYGMGLDLMRERVAELDMDGTFEVVSSPGEGTTVRVLLPSGSQAVGRTS